VNAAAAPPAVPTARSVTAGEAVVVPASAYSVATARASRRVQRSAVPWNCIVVPVMPAPGATRVSTPR